MSLRAMQWAWQHGPASSADMLVLLALADYAREDGRCWPSVETLARKARVAERTCRMALRRLEADGYLARETAHKGRHAQTYRLTLDTELRAENGGNSELPPEPNPAADAGFNPAADAGFSAPTRHLTVTNPAGDAPKPIKNHIYDGGDARAREADPHLDILTAAGIDWRADVSGKWFGSVERWKAERWETDLGLSRQEVLTVLREVMARKTDGPPGSLSYFDKPMAKRAGQIAALAKRLDPEIPQTSTGGHLSVRDPAVRAATLETAVAAWNATRRNE